MKRSLLLIALTAVFSGAGLVSGVQAAPAEVPLYVGTYTRANGSKGIYRSRLNLESGALSAPELVAEAKNPSFLALHPNGRFLYAALEEQGGAVGAFEILSDGRLKYLSTKSTKGNGACHVWVDGTGKYALAANYGSGSIAAFPIGADGSVAEASGFVQHTGSSVNAKRQDKPHAHSIYTDPENKRVYVCDLGTDQVWIYGLKADGSLSPNDPAHGVLPPGSGPRHLALSATHAYVINEMLSTMTVFKRDPQNGALSEVQTVSTLPVGWEGNSSTAEVFLHPSGKFLYGSNRGHDSIVVYGVEADGKLRLVGHASTQGRTPRGFHVDPTGKFLVAANQATNNIVSFRIDAESGKLTPAGHSIEVASPVCILFGK